MIGYILALVSSIFFGLYVVPRKLSKLEPIHFSLLMSLGFFAGSLVLYLLQPLLQFQETISPALLWSLLAGVAIFVSALFFSATTPETGKANSRGILLAILAGVGFGIVTVINKYVTDNVGVYLQQVVWSFGIVLALVVYAFFKNNLPTVRTEITSREVALGILAGLLYLGASFFMLQSYKYIDASVGFTIIQLNALWTIAIGIFIFNEVYLKQHRSKVWWGILFAIVGVILLLFTQR